MTRPVAVGLPPGIRSPCTLFLGADSNAFLQGGDEDLAVSEFPFLVRGPMDNGLASVSPLPEFQDPLSSPLQGVISIT